MVIPLGPPVLIQLQQFNGTDTVDIEGASIEFDSLIDANGGNATDSLDLSGMTLPGSILVRVTGNCQGTSGIAINIDEDAKNSSFVVGISADNLEDISAEAKIPEQMIEQEVNMSLMQFEYTIRQQGMDLNQYMQITNKTQDDLRNDVKDSSKNKIHLRKIIEAVIEKEKLEVSDDDINTEIQSWNDEKIKTIDDLKSSKQHNLESLKNNILDKKVREFLTNSAKIK